MLDVKTWLNSNSQNIKFVNVLKRQPTAYPYGVFDDSIQRRGSDLGEIKLYQHNITVALYSDTINATAEAAMETLFDAKNVDWLKDRSWVDEDKNYETVWNFTILEKE